MPITLIMYNMAILRSTQLVSLSPGQEEVQRHNLESTVLYIRSIGFVMYVTEYIAGKIGNLKRSQ